jgi:purine-nucleoside phosphorylase
LSDTRATVNRAVKAFVRTWSRDGLPRPAAGLVLGSGLGMLAERIHDARVIDPTRIAGFPKPSVPGHAGRVVSGTLGGVAVAAFVGRIHAYEGLPLPIVALPARFLCAVGVRALVLTNAAGSLHADWSPGDAMLVRDHLNLLGGSPLEGCRDEDFGSRFADVSSAWPLALRDLARRSAPRDLRLREGVYAACRGPQYETKAEIRMLRALGADAVGMSTVPEAIVAAQMGVPALGISLLTNLAAGVGRGVLDHEEVLAAGRRASAALSGWIERLVPLLPSSDRVRTPRSAARSRPRSRTRTRSS